MLGARKWKPVPASLSPERVTSIKTRFLGLPSAPFAATARRPRLMSSVAAVNVLLGFESVVPPALSELVRLNSIFSPLLPPVILPANVGVVLESVVCHKANWALGEIAMSLG